MTLTLLEIVNQAQMELGYPISSTIVGNPDPTTRQMFALTNRVLDDLRRMNRWTVCQFECNIVVGVPIITTGTITNDSVIITNIPDTTGIFANYFAVGANSVPQAARVLSVDSSTQITMTMEATGDVTDTDITFAQDTYQMPSDFDFFNNQTMWDRTNRWQLIGPDSPQQDQFQRSGVVATGPRRHFRQLGSAANRFRIWPQPVEITAPLQLVFEYLSLNGVAANGTGAIDAAVSAGGSGYAVNDTITLTGGVDTTPIVLTVVGASAGAVTAVSVKNTGIYTTQPPNPVSQISTSGSGAGGMFTIVWGPAYSQFFTDDADVPLLDAQAMITGLKWRFWQQKGFNYVDWKNEWIDYVEKLKARDGAAPSLTLARNPTSLLISSSQVQDGNFPGSSSS